MSIAETVDIIVVNRNGGDRLKNCINSIQSNTNGDYHLIVVDQNSKDGTREWLRDKVRHVILDRKRNTWADGRNKGLRSSRSGWVVFIDIDIVIKDSNWLDKMWEFTLNKRVGFIEAKVEVKKKSCFSGLSFCMIRKRCLDEIGQFDSSFQQGYEYDFFARLQWSWWTTGYCWSIDLVNSTGRGMNGCNILESELVAFRNEMFLMVGQKYTINFLEMTVYQNVVTRIQKVKDLLEVEDGGRSGNAKADSPGNITG